MKLNARWVIYGGLIVAAAVVVSVMLISADTPDPSRMTQRISRDPQKTDGVPIADVIARATTDDPLILSKWLDARTKRYRALFKDWHCDMLVLPVQVEGSAFDAPTRELMAGELALQLRRTDRCVTDPYLVDLALGEGLRRKSGDTALALAREIGAKTMVSTFVGHGRYDLMRITMVVEKLDTKSVAQHSIDGLKYGGDTSPFDVFRQNLARLLPSVGLDGQPAAAGSAGALPVLFPSGPNALHADDASPLTQAARLTLLGILAPRESHAAERLFTKALLALRSVGNDASVQRMRARILFHLFERPFALAKFKDVPGPEADGLRAIINGNLPEAQAALKQVEEPWERTYLGLEVYELTKIYSRKDDSAAAAFTNALGPGWAVLSSARMADDDGWVVPDLLAFKRLLDRDFAIPGQSLDETIRGGAVIGQFEDEAVYDLLAVKHVHALLEQRPRDFCCASFDPALANSDVIDLLDSRIEAALMRSVYYLHDVQGLPERALKQLVAFDAEVAGEPAAEELRSRIYLALFKSGRTDGQQDLNVRAYAAARIAAIVGQGQYRAVETALWALSQPAPDALVMNLGDAYESDYPIRSYWPSASRLKERIEFSSDDTRPIEELAGYRDAKTLGDMQLLLDRRYAGNPVAAKLRLPHAGAEGEDPDSLREAIRKDPNNWQLYATLANMYVKRGAYTDASAIAQSFPSFRQPAGENSVGLSNDAFQVADKLFSLGAAEESRPLLKIAADQNNGSAASVRSRARLALLDGDYAEAAQAFLQCGQHYNSMRDYRDYLALLFASGYARDAWAGFDQLARRNMGPQIWIAAMVGHRHDKLNATQLRQWLSEYAGNGSPLKDRDALVNYAVMEQIMDRRPPPSDFAAFVTNLAGPSRVKTKYGALFEGAFGDKPSHQVGPSDFSYPHTKGVPIKPRKLSDDFVVPNRYPLFVDAYIALRKGQFDESVRAFSELASYYDIETTKEWGFALPYFALAAAQSGDKLELEKYLEGTFFPNEWGTYLAKAVFNGLHGKHDEARRWLNAALQERPATEYWPLTTDYEYAEICTWLFDVTHDASYRQQALDWARSRRKVEPTSAWSHALVARLSDDDAERIEALAMAIYLDPQSAWAQQAPASLRSGADAWLKQHPPFKLEKREESVRTL